MNIKLWGVRGSLPTPLKPKVIEERIRFHLEQFQISKLSVAEYLQNMKVEDFGGYGGNTACIEVRSGGEQLIIDAGSGIRALGESMLSGPWGRGQGEVNLLFTHFHWDHLVGLPFFTPIFIPGNKINVYAVQDGLEDVFRHVFQKPYFPVPYERLGAELVFHKLEPRQAKMFGDLSVTPYQLDHPDPCWGYKIEKGGKCFSYCVDTECVRVTREDIGEDLPLYQNVDLMLFDAQYTLSEAMEKIDWGHASAPLGLDLAVREGVKKLVFVHHDPAASDEKIGDAQEQTQAYYKALQKEAKRTNKDISEFEWMFGQEGMEFEL